MLSLRLSSAFVVSVLAATSLATPAFADPPEGKGASSKEPAHRHGHGHKARARLEHGHAAHHVAPTAETPASKPSTEAAAAASPAAGAAAAKAKPSASGDKKSASDDKKPASDANDPPPELTGALPQAKLANRKPRAKCDTPNCVKDNVRTAERADDADAKHGSKKSTHEAGGKKGSKDSKSSRDEGRGEPSRADDGKLPPLPAPHGTKGKLGAVSSSLDADSTFPSLQHKSPDGRKAKLRSCLNPAVSFTRLGQPTDVQVVLTTCTGEPAPGAVDRLSILARPYDVPAPAQPESILSLSKRELRPSQALSMSSLNDEVVPGIRRIEPGLVQRAQAIAARFGNRTITIVSGYRPASKGSPHAAARAMDVRIDGVTNESLVEFCKTLADTGCGYYPNSSFVHVDVRPPGAGHVHWIDVSGPGEKPVYVKQWPLPAAPAPKLSGDWPDGLPSATTDEGAIGSLEDKDPGPSDTN